LSNFLKCNSKNKKFIALSIREKKQIKEFINDHKNDSTWRAYSGTFGKLIEFCISHNIQIEEEELIFPHSKSQSTQGSQFSQSVQVDEQIFDDEDDTVVDDTIIIIPNDYQFKKFKKDKSMQWMQKYVPKWENVTIKRQFPWDNKTTKQGHFDDLYKAMEEKYGKRGKKWDLAPKSEYGNDFEWERKIKSLNDGNLDHLLSLYVHSFLKEKYSRDSCRTYYINLCGIFKDRKISSNESFLMLRETINAVMKIKYKLDPDPHARKRSAYSDEQLKMMLESSYCKDNRPFSLLFRAMILLGIALGLRISELMNIEFTDFNIEIIDGKRYLSYFAVGKETKTMNGGIKKKIPDKKYLAEMIGSPFCPFVLLEKLKKHRINSRIFNKPNPKYNQNPKSWYLDEKYERQMRDAIPMVAEKLGFKGNFLSHSLRTTCVTLLFRKKIPKERIMRVSGHTSDAVMLYARDDGNMLNEITNILIPLTDFPLEKVDQVISNKISSDNKKKRDANSLNATNVSQSDEILSQKDKFARFKKIYDDPTVSQIPSWHSNKSKNCLIDTIPGTPLVFKNSKIYGNITINITNN
jgi:integrase